MLKEDMLTENTGLRVFFIWENHFKCVTALRVCQMRIELQHYIVIIES